MEVLADIVGPRPRVVFCGMAGAESTRSRDHYYDSPGGSFWESLHLSGLSPRLLAPTDDLTLPGLGLGLTDLVGRRDPHDPDRFVHDVDDLAAKVAAWEPEWLAFTSKTVAAAVARHRGVRRPPLGPQTWDLASASVFVLPGTSGANRRHDYDGRPNRLAWWRDLAQLAGPAQD